LERVLPLKISSRAFYQPSGSKRLRQRSGAKKDDVYVGPECVILSTLEFQEGTDPISGVREPGGDYPPRVDEFNNFAARPKSPPPPRGGEPDRNAMSRWPGCYCMAT